MPVHDRIINFFEHFLCCSDADVLLGSSQVSSPQHKPHQLDINPGQHSANGNF